MVFFKGFAVLVECGGRLSDLSSFAQDKKPKYPQKLHILWELCITPLILMIRTQRAAHPIDAWGSWWMNREGSLSPRWKGGMPPKT
jgi:hypothetical protein